ncbi:phage tail protein [uncultured Parasutterella sp.]|uniref:phage tail protein n=3 Tax=uncultured Parasutterella sp. TaxID=1263098 RepID=UPI00262EFF47|nr:phage tail protein [uncultured Parasutterella sp.]
MASVTLPYPTISPIANMSPATSKLWNDRYKEIDLNFAALQTAATDVVYATDKATMAKFGIVRFATANELNSASDSSELLVVSAAQLKKYVSQACANAALSAVPIGFTMWFLGTTVPTGYLIQNGASVLRSDYPELFKVIGTKFGAADSLHFNLPSGHHRFVEGTTTLSEVATYVEQGLPNMTGEFRLRTAALGDGSISKIGWARGAITDNDAEIGTSSAISTVSVTATQLFNFSANRSNHVFGASGTVQPSAMRALVLIRAF